MNVSSILSTVLLLIVSTSTTQIEAKALNQNQVKFRRLPPKEFSAQPGSSITIECEATSSPPPSIHWLKNGKRIQQNDNEENHLDDGPMSAQVNDVSRIALSSTRSRLFIDCASILDEAVYTCVAENAFHRISSHTKLTLINNDQQSIQDEVAALELATGSDQAIKGSALSAIPQCLSQRNSQQTTDPPRIYMWTHNIVEVQRNDVILFCRSNARQQQPQTSIESQMNQQSQGQASATNTADLNNNVTVDDKKSFISWTLPNDKLVTSEQADKFEILETGDLLIKDLRWTDLGSYICTVSDDTSSDSISTYVYPAAVKSASKRSPCGKSCNQ